MPRTANNKSAAPKATPSKAVAKATPKTSFAMPQEIVTDSKALGSAIEKWAAYYVAAGQSAHVLFVSALWHTAKHGNPALLNRVFSVLRDNDQTAARLFVKRAAILVAMKGEEPDPTEVTSEMLQALADAGKVVDFKQGSFIVVKGHTSDEAKMLVHLCETRFIKPDGKTDMLLLERNNMAAMRLVGDSQLLDGILRIAKSIDTESERTRVNVSDPVRKFLQGIADKAEVMKQQLNLSSV
jgi:hypothetical protein